VKNGKEAFQPDNASCAHFFIAKVRRILWGNVAERMVFVAESRLCDATAQEDIGITFLIGK
jgi:hypothetical protein